MLTLFVMKLMLCYLSSNKLFAICMILPVFSKYSLTKCYDIKNLASQNWVVCVSVDQKNVFSLKTTKLLSFYEGNVYISTKRR